LCQAEDAHVQVGVNYPWFDYGSDFGLGPPSWRGGHSTPRWYDEIDQDLRHLRHLGVSVVRWFILADGLTYGTGDDAPRLRGWLRRRWHFDPPPLNGEILAHFSELLARFASVSQGTTSCIQLLPVLIDFHFCQPGILLVMTPGNSGSSTMVTDRAWVKQGRVDAISNDAKRARFLENALDPLLKTSQQYSDVIYAWELINEPDWVTEGWSPNPQGERRVPESSMRAFIEEGSERIRRAGFKPTVGFASADTLRRCGVVSDVSQFHHYPGGATTLDRHEFDLGIVGEFATAATDVWPDLIDSGQTVLNRLRLAQACGYSLAVPWAFRSQDRHTTWSSDVENDVREFTRGRDSPGTA
jgi:hypothetical protein